MNVDRQIAPSRSALSQAGVDQAGFSVDGLSFHEIEDRAITCVRMLPGTPANAARQGGLPQETGACVEGDPAILCLRPGEWLAVSQGKEPQDLLNDIRRTFDPAQFACWDCSDALALIRVEGGAAPWLLRKHCGLDLPVDRLVDAHCTHTRFGSVSVLMHYYANASVHSFDLYFDRSLAHYIWSLLADSASHAIEMYREFNLRASAVEA